MFSLTNCSSHKNESHCEQMIANKRDRFRVEIRKTANKQRMIQRRTLLIDSLKNLELEILVDLARTEESLLSQDTRDELISRLNDCSDNREILIKVSQLKLVKRLTNYLKQSVNLEYKSKIASILLNLIYYSRETFEEFIEESIVDFVLAEMSSHSFQQHSSYLIMLLCLVRNLSSEVDFNFNLYLKDVSFCEKVTTKLQNEKVAVQKAVKQLMKIRANLLLTENSEPSVQLIQQTLNCLDKNSLGEFNHDEEYLLILIALIKTTDDIHLQSLLTNTYPEVYCHLMELLEQPLPSYEEIQQIDSHKKISFVIKLLYCVKTMISSNQMLLDIMEGFGRPSKELFYWALNCPAQAVANYAIKVFSLYITGFIRRFPQQPTDVIEGLVQLLLNKFWHRKTLVFALRVANTFAMNKFWTQATELLLKNNILTKLEEMLLSEHCKQAENLMLAMNLYGKLLAYGQQQQNGNKVLRQLRNRGIIGHIIALQMHENQLISKQVKKLTDLYFANLTDSAGFETDD